jgi:hypothetical protein
MKHDVKFVIPERYLGRADIEFHIKKNGRKFGTLKVSKVPLSGYLRTTPMVTN